MFLNMDAVQCTCEPCESFKVDLRMRAQNKAWLDVCWQASEYASLYTVAFTDISGTFMSKESIGTFSLMFRAINSLSVIHSSCSLPFSFRDVCCICFPCTVFLKLFFYVGQCRRTQHAAIFAEAHRVVFGGAGDCIHH